MRAYFYAVLAFFCLSANVNAQDTVRVKNNFQEAIVKAQEGSFISFYFSDYPFSALPDSLFKIPQDKLVALEIYNSSIFHLDENLTQFSNLDYFSMTWNKKKECPFQNFPTILLQMPQMKHISLEGQTIGEMPTEFHQLKKLEYLALVNCTVNDLSSIYGSPNLRFLQLKCNELSTIPKGIERLSLLETLWLEGGTCSNGEMISLPSDFVKLRRLKSLKIGGGLQKIFRLPESFYKLEKLEKLELENMAMENLPKKFHLLKNLKYFSLATDSRFKSFPSAFTELQQLDEFYFQIHSNRSNTKVSKQILDTKVSFQSWGAGLKAFSFQILSDKINSIGSN